MRRTGCAALVTAAQLDCTYRLGQALDIVIAGVGLPNAAVTMVRADNYYQDYYAMFGVMHGCVIVKPGSDTLTEFERTARVPDFTFVSPTTGNAYRTCKECGTTTRASEQ